MRNEKVVTKTFVKSYSGPMGIAKGRMLIEVEFVEIQANGAVLHFRQANINTYVCGESDMRNLVLTGPKDIISIIKHWDKKMDEDLARAELTDSIFPLYSKGLMRRGFMLQGMRTEIRKPADNTDSAQP